MRDDSEPLSQHSPLTFVLSLIIKFTTPQNFASISALHLAPINLSPKNFNICPWIGFVNISAIIFGPQVLHTYISILHTIIDKIESYIDMPAPVRITLPRLDTIILIVDLLSCINVTGLAS